MTSMCARHEASWLVAAVVNQWLRLYNHTRPLFPVSDHETD